MTLPEYFKLMIADGPGAGKIFELLPLIFIFAMYIIGSILKNKEKPTPPARQVKKPPIPTAAPASSREPSRQQQQRQNAQPQPGRVIAVPQGRKLTRVVPLIRAVGQPRTRPVQPTAAAKSIGPNINQRARSIPIIEPIEGTLRPESPLPRPKSVQQVSRRPLIPRGRNALAQAIIYAEIVGKPLALRSDQNGQYLL
jgi:hypothetical protein